MYFGKDAWIKKSKYHWVCGRYTICVAKVGDQLKYCAWSPDEVASGFLGVYPDSDQARSACEQHYNQPLSAPRVSNQ